MKTCAVAVQKMSDETKCPRGWRNCTYMMAEREQEHEGLEKVCVMNEEVMN